MTTATLQTDTQDGPRTLLSRRLPLPVAPDFALVDSQSEERCEVEDYIAQKFARSYGAHIEHFMPRLLTLRCDNYISAAVGIRCGAEGELFVEHYLDAAVEKALAEHTGSTVQREQIIEIGNLVSTWRGSSQLLFIALCELVCHLNCEWTIFTATPEVRKLLSRLGLQQIVLCHADGNCLGEELAKWGSYYDTQPAVTAINAFQARRFLQEHRLTRELLTLCSPLIHELFDRGEMAL